MTSIIEKHLGSCGRMISASKSGYVKRHPQNLVAFNANLISNGAKIWYGDIDVTKDEDALKLAAKEMNSDIYILREMDARFDNEFNPKLENAIFVAKA